MPVRGAFLLAGLIGLSACSGALAPATERPAPGPTTTTEQATAPVARAAPPRAARTPQLRISDLIGRAPTDIDARIGAPDLVRREGDGEVRIYTGSACILHVFAYPASGASRATHIEARTRDGRLVGEAVDNCVANFGRT